jgi:hypothetical protein
VLDKNTVKLVAGEYDLLVVDKEEASVTDGARKQRDFLELEDVDEAVSVITVLQTCVWLECFAKHHGLTDGCIGC